MVAKLVFPTFSKHRASPYHRYLAEVVDFGAKVSDPAFRARAMTRHLESFSSLRSFDASQHLARSMITGYVFAKAVDEGFKAFWGSWFAGLSETNARFVAAFAETRKSALLVSDRSDDGHVLSVRFDNRFLSDRALGQIKQERRARSAGSA